MADRQPQARLRRVLAKQRQAVRSGSAEAGPGTDRIEAGEPRQVVQGTPQHARQHRAFHLRVERVELPRGAEEDLPGGARLGVEGYRGTAAGVGAADIAEFHQLMAEGAGIAVGDQQVAFLRADRQLRAQLAGMDAVGQHQRLGAQPAAVGQAQAAAVHFADFGVQPAQARPGLVEQPVRGVGRVEDAVAGHLQGAGQARPQGRFEGVQARGAKHPAGNAGGLQRLALAFGLGEFAGVGGQPEGAAIAVRAVFRQIRRPGAPGLDRVVAEGQFGRVVVHRHQMAHAHRGGTAAAAVQHQYVEAATRQFMGAGAADDAGADHDDLGVHRRMPQANGSSSASSRVASALTWARPRMVGTMRPPGWPSSHS